MMAAPARKDGECYIQLLDPSHGSRRRQQLPERGHAHRQFRGPPLGHVGLVWGWKPSFVILGFWAVAG